MADANPAAVLQALSWKPGDTINSLNAVRDYVEQESRRLAEWYYQKKTWKARMSAALRVLAIAFFTLGGLVPLVRATFPTALAAAAGQTGFDLGQAGYLLIAFGAASIALDRFFGYSSGWIRYVTTAMAIERSVDEFRLEWARATAALGGADPNPDQMDRLMQLCKSLVLSARAQVEQETKAWVMEFQSNLSDLEKSLKARADEAKGEGAKAAETGAG